MNKIELLSPAGDLKRCKTAIRYGADAVYIGGKSFSLRSRASNFEIKDIKEACDFAKDHNAKIYVTINIIPHNDDLNGLEEYLIALKDAGVKAFIIASPYIASVAKKVVPEVEVHLSTQMNTTNSKIVEEVKSWNVDRVVLSRECSMEEIKDITSKNILDTEVFIHGGMCSNYSGRCTISNVLTLRDANRGGCAQSCRWKYHLLKGDEVISDENCLLSMSSKDLMAVRYIKDMIDANVTSLKIEGRMKSEYYIATVIKTYRQLIDEIYEKGTISEERLSYYEQEINRAENRPTATGFLKQLPDENYHLYGVNGAGVTHDFLAYVLDYDDETKFATIEVRNYFALHDEIEVLTPNIDPFKLVLDEMYDEDGNLVEIANKPTQILKVKVTHPVKRHDMFRKSKI